MKKVFEVVKSVVGFALYVGALMTASVAAVTAMDKLIDWLREKITGK